MPNLGRVPQHFCHNRDAPNRDLAFFGSTLLLIPSLFLTFPDFITFFHLLAISATLLIHQSLQGVLCIGPG